MLDFETFILVTFIVVFVAILFLPRFWKYLLNGFLLVSISILAILYMNRKIFFDIMSIPILYYLIKVIIFLEGKNLLVEGVKEHKGIIKYLTIGTGILLICLTTIPELFRIGAISFNIPEIPILYMHYIYIFSGCLIIIGAFSVNNDKKPIKM